MEAFASPICGRSVRHLAMPNDACAVPTVAQAMKPPLTIISGLAPKFSGFQSTKSARQPFATWPTMCEIP